MVTAEQLRAARAILQMDQAELAKISGMSVETIKRLERQTGKLHAKIETILAIKKAFEAQHLEFLGDHDGRGAGVRLVHPNKLQHLIEGLIGTWGQAMDQWLKAQCATDPKFFERGEKRLTQTLTSLSARVMPTIVRGMLSDPQNRWWENVTAPDQCGINVERDREQAPVLQRAVVTPELRYYAPMTWLPLSMSAPERALADARYVTPAMLGLIEDATNLGAASNRAFTRAFVAAIPRSELGALTDAQGALSADGLTRVRNALLAKAYGYADMLIRITESTDDEITSLSNGLVMAAPQWAAFRADVAAGRIRADVDMTGELMQAVKRIADILAQGQSLEKWLVEHGAMNKFQYPIESWMRMLYDHRVRRVQDASNIAEGLKDYAEEARKVSDDPDLGSPELVVTGDKILSNVRHLRRIRLLSAPERALADARYVTPAMLGLIEDATNLGAASNRAFTRAFVAAIPRSELGALTDAQGALSADGLTRVRNALLAKAYGYADMLIRITESTDDEITSLSNGLVMAAPQWAAFRADVEAGRVRADFDLTDALVQAVKQTADIRARGQKVEEYFAQQNVFDKLPGPIEGWMLTFYDEHGKRVAGAPQIADGLRFYAEEAAKVTIEQNRDLDKPEVTRDEIQSNVLHLRIRRRA